MLRLRSLAWVLLPVVALAAAAAVVQVRRTAFHWREAVDKIETQSRLVADRRVKRQALWGRTEPGLAFEQYRLAMETADHLGPGAGQGLHGPGGGAISEVDLQNPFVRHSLLSDPLAHQVLEALRRGAHLEDATIEVDWSERAALPLDSPSAPHKVRLIAHAAAYEALENDEPLEAARWVLDVLQFGADLSAGPTYLVEMVGVGMLSTDPGLTTDQTDGAWGRLGPQGRRFLVRGLRRLENRLAWTRPFPAGEFVYIGRGIQEAAAVGHPPVGSPIGEDLSSLLERGQLTGFLVTSARWNEMYSAAVDHSWDAALRVADEIENEARVSENESLVVWGSHARDTLESRLFYTTKVRALRIALEALDGEAEDDPIDLLGAPLKVDVDHGVARVHSTSDVYPRFELITSTRPLAPARHWARQRPRRPQDMIAPKPFRGAK